MTTPPRTGTRRFNKRHVRIGNLLLVPLYVFAILLPFGYTWRAEIPPPDQLQVITGELTHQDVGRGGDRLTGLKTASGTLYFSCATAKFDHPNCLKPPEYERLQGKVATVWWFEQPIYPFIKQKRLVRLLADDKERKTYEMTLRDTESAKKIAPWFMVVAAILFLSIGVGFERAIRRQDHEQQRRG